MSLMLDTMSSMVLSEFIPRDGLYWFYFVEVMLDG